MVYRKRPILIEAFKWEGDRDAIVAWLTKIHAGRDVYFNNDNTLTIPTLEGDHLASLGDYIICGVEDELYPCKPGIFHKTYEEI